MAPKAKGKSSVVKKSSAPAIPEATLIYYRECLEVSSGQPDDREMDMS